MAHGSKKWIKTYRGKLKRSRHRTFQDKLGDAWPYDRHDKKFCPQCRHIQKKFEHDNAWREAKLEELEQRFNKKYEHKLVDIGTRYRCIVTQVQTRWGWSWTRHVHWWEWARSEPDYPGPAWHLDPHTTLCYRCTDRENAHRRRWRERRKGTRQGWSRWQKQAERQWYRAECKRLMQQERYDDILPRKKQYLD